LVITPGNTHDLVGARTLLTLVQPPRSLLADRAYDANSLRDELVQLGIKPVIPPNPTRKHPHCYDKRGLQRPQRHRMNVLLPQRLPPNRHPI
jgi:IS5 family transposase